MRPSLQQLQHLVVLAETRNFTRAAKACHISQPAFSRSIGRLEELVGGQMVVRARDAVVMTALGAMLVERAMQILQAVDRALAEAKPAATDAAPLRLGVIEYVYHLMAPTRLHAFAGAGADVTLLLLDIPGERMEALVRRGSIEMAFVAVTDDWCPARSLSVMKVFREQLAIVVARGHRLSQRTDVQLAELREEPLVMFRRDTAPCVFDEILAGARSDRQVRQRVTEVGLLQTMLNAVTCADEVGIAALSVTSACPPGVAVIPIGGVEAPHVTLALVWAGDRPVYQRFGRWVTEVIRGQWGPRGEELAT